LTGDDYLGAVMPPRVRDGERIEKHTSATNEGQPPGFMWTYLHSRRPPSSTATRR
jgi:hypothetical protein